MYYIAKGKKATLATRKTELDNEESEIFEFEINDIFKILQNYDNVYLSDTELFLKENNTLNKGQFIVEQNNILEHYLLVIDTHKQEIYRPAFMLHCIDGNDYLITDVKSVFELNVSKILTVDSESLKKVSIKHNLSFTESFFQFVLVLGELSNNYTILSSFPEDEESYTHINLEQANELINSKIFEEMLQASFDSVGKAYAA